MMENGCCRLTACAAVRLASGIAVLKSGADIFVYDDDELGEIWPVTVEERWPKDSE